MPTIVPFKDADLGVIYIQVEDIPNSSEAGEESMSIVKTANPTQKVVANLQDALDSVGKLAGKITQAIVNNPMFPDEIECKLGIKFTADASIMIANVGSEGSLELTLKWNSKQLADRNEK